MPLIEFIIPEKVVMEKEGEHYAKFLFRPLEPGFGTTVGNALRRVLLSSVEGYAITSIKIPGVLHEFSTIPGVIEDVVDIVLNLKGVRLKKVLDGETKIFVSVRNQTVFTAADIGNSTNAFEVTNPEHIIAHLSPDAQLDIELTVGKGRGYRPAEENKTPDMGIGEIAIDSIFTPIRNVKITVENTRVEQKTDYEQLLLEVTTDGTIDPETALKEAANILIKHFMLFSDSNIQLKTQEPAPTKEVDENFLAMRKLLKTPLSELDLSVRAYNCLKAAEIKTLGDLVSYNIADLLKFRNFGKKSLSELEELVANKNLTFGMDVAKYHLDED
ncbi:MAG: DNA-directed RNA polymerase subunit alpha [Bacteroidia bacterium]|nr:DNA-directed RNA polymerase subunit alpha [Bacteroidia bacterium]MDW8159364.1 DNA-directed RNA polymerase subunit alpha [Bacteroidia bacterium]